MLYNLFGHDHSLHGVGAYMSLQLPLTTMVDSPLSRSFMYISIYNFIWSTTIHSHGVGGYMLHSLFWSTMVDSPSSRSFMYISSNVYNLFGQRPFTPMESVTTYFTAYLINYGWLSLELELEFYVHIYLISPTTIHSQGIGSYVFTTYSVNQPWSTLHGVHVLTEFLWSTLTSSSMTHHRLHPAEHVSYSSGTLKYDAAASDPSNANMAFISIHEVPPDVLSHLQLVLALDQMTCRVISGMTKATSCLLRKSHGWRSSYTGRELPGSTCLWNDASVTASLIGWSKLDRWIEQQQWRPLQIKTQKVCPQNT